MRKFYVTTIAMACNISIWAQQTDTIQQKQQLQEVVISGVKATTNNPITFTNITKAEIAKQNFGQDLPFLLNLTPSAVVNSDAGAGVGYTGIRIRGTDGARTNVTINGVPVNDAESHGTFWVNMPDFASSTQGIQVQRGVGTSSNGAAAFGASINIETDYVQPKPYAELANSIGSFNTLKHTIKAGTGLMDNKWAFDARLSKISSDGFIDRAASDLKSFFVSAGRYGEKSILKFNVFSGTEKTYQAWNGIAEDIMKTGNRTHNDFTYSNQTDNYQQDNYQLFYTYQLGKYWKTNIGLHYTYGRGYYEEYRTDETFTTYKLKDSIIVDGNTIKSGDFIRRRWLDNDFYGTVFSASYQKQKWNIIMGGSANRYEGRHFGELIWSQYALGGNINDKFYEGTSTKTDISVYAKATYQFTVKLTGFVDLQQRVINYQGLGEDLNNGVYLPYNFTLPFTFTNPKAGITYTLADQENIYAYVGVANKEPVRNDIIQASASNLPNPEQLINYEFGYRKNWKKSALSANAYYMDYKNQLVATGQLNDVGAYNRVNVANSYRAGVELTGGFQLTEALNWQATFTFSRNKIKAFTEFLDDYDNGGQQTKEYKNTTIAFSPNVVGSSVFSYRAFQNVTMDVISKFVGKQYLDNTESEDRKLNHFFVNDIRLGYDFKVKNMFETARIGLLVGNIFNVKYEPNGATYPGGISGGVRTDYNYYYPQAGTNFMTSVTLRF